MTIDNLFKKLKEVNPDADLELIKKAYSFAEKYHRGQKRKSGQDYIQHPLHTAYTLTEMRLDSETIAAGLLHDLIDDTTITNDEIKKEFGKNIARLTEGITKLGKIKYRGIERQVENLRKMFLAMAEDIRVVLIKLADRLHNMETLEALPPEKQKRIALETLEIFAPLAYRLGIGELKGRLEDLAFPYAYPKEYEWLINQVKDHFEQRKKYLLKIIPILEKELDKEHIKYISIHSRAKHYWSLYKKLQRYDQDLNKIHDLVALRIIVKTIEDCYAALGAIHKIWRPLPGRIKDYISMRKPNGYQSLHTTVFCEEGKITEFQIRTEKMHEEAELGIAAHWYYAEQKGFRSYIKKKLGTPPEKELNWVRQLQDWQKEIKAESPSEYLESLKIDFFKDRIFVLTPKGDVIDLPEGATAIDFAYQIHTDIGNHCNGVKIDGKLSPLDQILLSGQVIEIITQKNENINSNWLKIVKTSIARARIRNWLRKNKKPTDFLLFEKQKKEEQSKQIQIIKTSKISTPKLTIKIEGKDKILSRLAKCCNPKPGDKIEGYITVTRGVSIHKNDCINLESKKESGRIIPVSWS